MYKAKPFHDWVPNWLTTVVVLLLLIAQAMVSGVSSYSIEEVTSSLGQEAELIKIAFYASSIGLVAMLPFYYRLRLLFQRKQMLLLFLTIEVILCVIAPSFKHEWEFIVISFLTGAVKCVCLLDCIGLLMTKLNPANSRGLFYGIYYPISFVIGQITSLYAAYLVVNYEWAFTYYTVVPGLLISIGLVLTLMHSFRSQRKVPLYQIDWYGMALFIIFSFSITAVCIYGERLEWFDSKVIQIITLITISSFILFIFRSLTVKRPYVDLSTLMRYPQTAIGISLMMILYLGYNSTGVTTAYMSTVLKYDSIHTAEISASSIIAFVTVIPFVGWLLHKHYPTRIFLCTGFLLLAVYHFISSSLFYAEQEISYLVMSQILKGAAYGICISTLSYYASANVAREFNGHRAFLSVASRYVIATPITGALFSHWLTASTRLHYTLLSANFTNQNTTLVHNVPMLLSPNAPTNISMSTVRNHLNIQSLILGSIDIYMIVGVIFLFIAIAVLFIKYLDVHYSKHYKNYAVLDV